MLRALLLALVLPLAACADDATTTTTPSEEAPATGPAPSSAESDFAPGLNVDLAAMTQTPSGLYYRDVSVGDGAEAVAGRRVDAHYEGFLTDGTPFDASDPSGDPISFPLGAGAVIQGWDEGVAGMRVGGRRQLVIPPDLAYGPEGIGPIPPNSTLVFNVHLVGVE